MDGVTFDDRCSKQFAMGDRDLSLDATTPHLTPQNPLLKFARGNDFVIARIPEVQG